MQADDTPPVDSESPECHSHQSQKSREVIHKVYDQEHAKLTTLCVLVVYIRYCITHFVGCVSPLSRTTFSSGGGNVMYLTYHEGTCGSRESDLCGSV